MPNIGLLQSGVGRWMLDVGSWTFRENGNIDDHARAGAETAAHAQLGAEPRGARLHVVRAVARGGSRRRVEPGAVILHQQADFALPAVEPQGDHGGAAM